MKKLIITLLMFGFVNASMAQINREPTPSFNNSDSTQKISKKEMMDELDLTKEQRTNWKQIHQNEKAQKDAIMSNDSLTMEQKQMQLKVLHKQTNQAINSILTDGQKAKMQAIKQEMKDNKMNNQNNNMQDNSKNNQSPIDQ